MRRRRPECLAVLLGALTLSLSPARPEEPVQLDDIVPDLFLPLVGDGEPAPGKRVRRVLAEYAGTGIHHLLYLPGNWEPGKSWPVIFEYPGNRWRTSPGTMEGCQLGYGISGGRDAIWVCLPFVDPATGAHAPNWWGEVEATVEYAKRAVRDTCENFGGEPDALFLAGFSRGAIACNYIGLHDDEIASLWRGFICHSHYDGVRSWPYEGSDRASARERLARLGDRPQFISHENSVEQARSYLAEVYPSGNFTFLSLPFREHTARWTLRDIPARETLRKWFREQLPRD